ncbi:MAG: 1,4-alpha-glucan branching protein GlgB [Chloroflexota bacterium]|nr:1,4-alpha-glucan branching protein GlgB [Chloroflexota bacterium]
MALDIEIHPDAVAALVEGRHGAPFDLLGPHAVDGGVAVRAFRPWAKELAVVLPDGAQHPMEKIHTDGLFSVVVDGAVMEGFAYRLKQTDFEGVITEVDDPYRFGPLMSDVDLYLWGEGNLLYAYDAFGAHVVEHEGVRGVNFAVWAPNALRISIIGGFNRWDERGLPMRMRTGGVWELFVPGIGEGEVYRYDIRSHNQGWRFQKSDPFAFFSEVRPANASIVTDLSGYRWGDSAWMEARAQSDPLKKPMAIYEVHLGSWQRHDDGSWLTYTELADKLITYVKDMGYTHIELMPVTEYPYDGSWGYQVTGYFAATSRYGTPHQLMALIDAAHQAGIGVILDWVPAHFPKDGHGLNYFDGTHLYEHEHPLQREHPDWGTLIFNFGRNEVRNFLLASALFWLKEYHVDGLRVDAVSSIIYLDFSREQGQWIPNRYGGRENLDAISFLRQFNEVVHREAPGAITIAEESTAWPMVSRPIYIGGLGFTLKWNMGWMHDTLEYLKADPIYRRWKHDKITFSLFYAFSENFVLSLSHDEVVHLKGSMINKAPGDWWQKFATVRLLFGYMYTHPGKKLNFMGSEIGQWREWSEARQLDWHLLSWDTHQSLQNWCKRLNAFYCNEPSLWQHDFDFHGFNWIDANDNENSVFSYVRYADDKDDLLIVIASWTPVVRYDYRIGVPKPGTYREVLNSDAAEFGGGGVGNPEPLHSQEHRHHEWEHSLTLTVPPLAVIVLRPDREPEREPDTVEAPAVVAPPADPDVNSGIAG